MRQRNHSRPISVPASQAWDGNDGPWSTFHINAGNPPQVARVLVSTVVGETWVISANKTQGGCLEKIDSDSCPDLRGGLVNVNESTSWQDEGIYALGAELNLPDYMTGYDNGNYGLDTVGIGLPNSGGIRLNGQVVGAVATKSFYLGSIGVTSRPANFTGFNDPHTSLLSSLREQHHISSLTFGYTAGNQYRLKKVYGSLTLGGYDKSKFIPNHVSFQFATDITRDLLVGLQSITYSDNDEKDKVLLSKGILTFVDATVPHIWLPEEVCKAFEKAFGLQYNSTANRYLVNDTLHERLQAQKPSVTFTLGNNIAGGANVKITLPYDAFDLQVKWPIVEKTQRYFPLRRAANDTQYTLGRTFLQESYLIVDYERSNFSLSECLWEGNRPPELIGISSANLTGPGITKTRASLLSVGAIVGIVAAIVILLALCGLGTFFFYRRRRREKQEREELERKEMEEAAGDPAHQKAELGGIPKPQLNELYGEFKPELEADGEINEMEGSKGTSILMEGKLRAEMEGSEGMSMEKDSGKSRQEMHASTHGAPVEMWAGPFGLYELSPDSERTCRPSPPSRLPSSSGDGQPSPESSSATLRNSRSGFTWARRHRSIQSAVHGDSSGVSSPTTDDPSTEHENSGSELWGGRRTSRPRFPPRAVTPQEISPQSSQSNRTRRGDHLTHRLEQTSRSKHDSHLSISSPTSESDTVHRPAPAESGADRWNSRFGSRPRTDASQHQSTLSPTGETPGRRARRAPSPEGISPSSVGASRGELPKRSHVDSWTSQVSASAITSPGVSSPDSEGRRSPREGGRYF